MRLHRARLFHDRAALAEARQLIDDCGYERRRGELEDAEHALGAPASLPATSRQPSTDPPSPA